MPYAHRFLCSGLTFQEGLLINSHRRSPRRHVCRHKMASAAGEEDEQRKHQIGGLWYCRGFHAFPVALRHLPRWPFGAHFQHYAGVTGSSQVHHNLQYRLVCRIVVVVTTLTPTGVDLANIFLCCKFAHNALSSLMQKHASISQYRNPRQ